ncbi:excisionase family DNA binding protein [Paenibacillus barcinonensis]|uniref:Excisionase family DNA binding protein n=1 Tax=Paenibacillus barcinonensis TaxID=198119 RepID=A0A2V4USL5_PAEBA|nr:helix-turn-helix domain-containing protein [Paenibacillus barcinonensis]PYE42119.1 excisionase family DNA binding protein [Paenibacillus barcinonensis]
MTSTVSFIEVIRADIKRELREELLSELQPELERMIYANVFEVKEAARYLKVSTSTLRRMVKDREIDHFRIRDVLHFRQIDLDNYVSGLIVKQSAGGS